MSVQRETRNSTRQSERGNEAELQDKAMPPPKKVKPPSKSRKGAAKDLKDSESTIEAEPPKICDTTGFYKHTGGDFSNRWMSVSCLIVYCKF